MPVFPSLIPTRQDIHELVLGERLTNSRYKRKFTVQFGGLLTDQDNNRLREYKITGHVEYASRKSYDIETVSNNHGRYYIEYEHSATFPEHKQHKVFLTVSSPDGTTKHEFNFDVEARRKRSSFGVYTKKDLQIPISNLSTPLNLPDINILLREKLGDLATKVKFVTGQKLYEFASFFNHTTSDRIGPHVWLAHDEEGYPVLCWQGFHFRWDICYLHIYGDDGGNSKVVLRDGSVHKFEDVANKHDLKYEKAWREMDFKVYQDDNEEGAWNAIRKRLHHI